MVLYNTKLSFPPPSAKNNNTTNFLTLTSSIPLPLVKVGQLHVTTSGLRFQPVRFILLLMKLLHAHLEVLRKPKQCKTQLALESQKKSDRKATTTSRRESVSVIDWFFELKNGADEQVWAGLNWEANRRRRVTKVGWQKPDQRKQKGRQ